jgi:hypothetical protein
LKTSLVEGKDVLGGQVCIGREEEMSTGFTLNRDAYSDHPNLAFEGYGKENGCMFLKIFSFLPLNLAGFASLIRPGITSHNQYSKT